MINKLIYKFIYFILYKLGIGDWGLGIGPNPQSPIPNITYNNIKLHTLIKILLIIIKLIIIIINIINYINLKT